MSSLSFYYAGISSIFEIYTANKKGDVKMLRAKWIRNAPDGNGTLFRGDIYQVPMNGLLGGTTGQRVWELKTVAQYSIGTRLITEDGRVFRYAKSGGACYTGQGCAIYPDVAISGNSTGALVATDKQITFAYAVAGTFAKDALKGGYITIFGGTPANADCPQRYITGNNANGVGALTLDLDAPVGRVVDDAQFCEVYYSPYADLRLGTLTTQSFAGVAATYVSAASVYFWVQTWGPCWIAPQVASFNSGEYRDAYFRHDGSIQAYSEDQSDPYALNKQRAGFIIQTGLTAGPLLMLQVSP